MGAFRDAYGRIYVDWNATTRSNHPMIATRIDKLKRLTQSVDEGHDPGWLKQQVDLLADEFARYVSIVERIGREIAQLQADVDAVLDAFEQPNAGFEVIDFDDFIERVQRLHGHD